MGLSFCDCEEPAEVREVRAGFPAGKHRLTIIKVKELILSLVNKITNSSNGDTASV